MGLIAKCTLCALLIMRRTLFPYYHTTETHLSVFWLIYAITPSHFAPIETQTETEREIFFPHLFILHLFRSVQVDNSMSHCCRKNSKHPLKKQTNQMKVLSLQTTTNLMFVCLFAIIKCRFFFVHSFVVCYRASHRAIMSRACECAFAFVCARAHTEAFATHIKLFIHQQQGHCVCISTNIHFSCVYMCFTSFFLSLNSQRHVIIMYRVCSFPFSVYTLYIVRS